MVKVKILGSVVTQQYGTLKTDDILVTSEDFAKHLVDDCKAAEYLKEEILAKAEKPAKDSKGK